MVVSNLGVRPGLQVLVLVIFFYLVFVVGYFLREAYRYTPKGVELRATSYEGNGSFVGFSMFPNGTLSRLNLTPACETALYQTIHCANETFTLMSGMYGGSFENQTTTALVCDSSCEASIAYLHENVALSCGETSELIPGLPFLGLVGLLWNSWNQSCLLDPVTGSNCNAVIAAYPNFTEISDLPMSEMCSYCYVKRLALMQGNAYTDVYDENRRLTYETVAKNCNLTTASVNATTTVFNVSVDSTPVNCVSGNTYITKSGDTCDSIARAHSVSAATMFYTNPNIIDCSKISEGTGLCLPLSCSKLYVVKENDTCTSIAVDSGVLTRNVLSYNTQLNSDCTNLQSTSPYWGSTLCVSPPGGMYRGQALKNTVSSDESSAVVAPPASVTVANGTTLDCGGWYVNNGALTCTQLCLSYVIAINLLTEANPSLNKTSCDADLVLGSAYCINPLEGWDLGSSSIENTSTSSSSATMTTGVLSTSTSVVKQNPQSIDKPQLSLH